MPFEAILMACFTTALGIAVTWFWRGRTAIAIQKEQHIRVTQVRDEERDLAIKERALLQSQIHVLAESMVPVKEALRAIIVKGLTHSVFPEFDAILAKIESNTLTLADEERLYAGIKDRIANPGKFMSEAELDMAQILLPLMRLIEAERVLGVSPALSVLHPLEKVGTEGVATKLETTK